MRFTKVGSSAWATGRLPTTLPSRMTVTRWPIMGTSASRWEM